MIIHFTYSVSDSRSWTARRRWSTYWAKRDGAEEKQKDSDRMMKKGNDT